MTAFRTALLLPIAQYVLCVRPSLAGSYDLNSSILIGLECWMGRRDRNKCMFVYLNPLSEFGSLRPLALTQWITLSRPEDKVRL